MALLHLKSTYKAFKDYFNGVKQLRDSDHLNEGAVAPLFANLPELE